MNDVIPECGGYMIVHIAPDGIIRDRPPSLDALVVHRETRMLQEVGLDCYFPTFGQAKAKLVGEDQAILELTSEGGGAALWMREEQIPELSARRDKWKGCYGAWPIHTLSI